MEDSLENLSIINKEIIQFNKALKLIFTLKNKIKVDLNCLRKVRYFELHKKC